MSGVWGCSLLFPAKKNLHPGFARLSPVFVMLGFVLTIAAAPVKTTAGAAATAVKRPSASAQFARAEEQRAALNSKPTEKRTLADYKLVVTAYRRVASVTPRAAEAPDSLRAIAELYTEMGDRFGRNYYQSAADSYQFLVHEYPTSKHCQDAILRVAKLQRDQLGDATLAKKTYEDFLKRYPRSPRKREAQEALAELALLQNDEGQSAKNSVAPDSTAALPTAEAARASAPVHAGGKSVSRPGSREIPRVRRIRADGNGDETRAVQNAPAKGSAGDMVSLEQPAENTKSTISGTINGSAISGGAANGSTAGSNSSAVPRNSLPSAKNAKSKSVKARATSAKPDLIQPASAPQPTRDGQSTLTRALGLKVGRIVIDAGHGGHDTGTIGPTGLMEKDLCLDVALRLGKIIEQRLPGADVVYTRADDTFVPLEERTNIANQAKADLFISIHANSSRDTGARGIETYYLNLKGSAEAMEVAARENATAQEGVHDLETLVKKIAQTEKIDESKEFAQDIQDSLAKRIQKFSRSVRNRGVRKAPFVVLIGADMPSILTEISFLSNPADEKLLKQPEQRQKLAEGLYQGISSYLQNMNSVTVNLSGRKGSERSRSTATVEQSRNQR